MRLWGAAETFALGLPESGASVVLLALEAALLVLLFVRRRAALRSHSPRGWATVAGLSAAAFVTSQLFALDLPWTNALLDVQPDLMAVNLLAALPWLLAGAVFNPASAAIVGLAGGLGRALGQTGSLLDVTQVGLMAASAALLMEQRYSGRMFDLLRQPAVAGLPASLVGAALTGLKVFAALLGPAGALAALDMGLFVGLAALPVFVLEALVGGIVAMGILRAAPSLRPARGTLPSPLSTSLQAFMTANYVGFAAILLALSAGVIFVLSTRTLSRAAVQQMAYNADAAANRIPALQAELSNVLVQYSNDARLVTGTLPERDEALRQLSRSEPLFGEVLLLNADGTISSPGGARAALTPVEAQAVDDALASGRPALAAGPADPGAFSLIVPLSQISPTAALIGRVPQASVTAVLADLPGPNGSSNGYVVDGDGQVLLSAGSGPAPAQFALPEAGRSAIFYTPADADGQAYEMQDERTGARRLVYTTLVPGSTWRVVATTPHEVILRQSLGVIGPVAGLLAVVSLIFFASVTAFGRSVTGPLAEMAATSKAIATGSGLEKTVRVQRADEVGQLSLAFGQMQRSLKQRLDELGLLLTVSNEVASSINISQGMPAVLQGVLRGTGAAGARAVVRNPNAAYPLIFAEGPASESMAALDRAVMGQARRTDELILSSPAEVQEALGVEAGALAALYALPLRSSNEFQGVLYVGYRQPHYFDSSERNLLRTLAGQAAVLVQNAHLFSAAESGRRRLAAILASTTNAVLVTDQTDRILLVNPALERAFGLKVGDVAGRPVADVIRQPALVERLTLGGAVGRTVADGKVEVDVNGRTFLATIATVNSNAGLAMGRVAVLHDVTDFKELDRLKSDFLAGISHDLLSPLTSMRNNASLLTETGEPALQQEYVDKILGGIDRMTRMVNDLLELARIEARIDLVMAPVDVRELLVDVRDEYWAFARKDGLSLVVAAPAGLPRVMGDAGLLRRALVNLVVNAIKYAPNSGELTLRAAVVRGEMVLAVEDRGPGIPAAELPNLFDRFYRARQPRHDKVRGSGLGLAIVKSIAEQHGGRAGCASAAGQGSVFTITLPLEQAPAPAG
jgi:PAS domain S-box-containing protein